MSSDSLDPEYVPHRELMNLLHLSPELTQLVAALFHICDRQLQLHWSYTLSLLVLLAPRLCKLMEDPRLIIAVADGRYLSWHGENFWHDLRTGELVASRPTVVTQAVDIGRLYHLEIERNAAT